MEFSFKISDKYIEDQGHYCHQSNVRKREARKKKETMKESNKIKKEKKKEINKDTNKRKKLL